MEVDPCQLLHGTQVHRWVEVPVGQVVLDLPVVAHLVEVEDEVGNALGVA